jgi:hypothetical protein
MKRVIVISPYEPDEYALETFRGVYSYDELMRQNLAYARMALSDALSNGEAAFSPTLLYAGCARGIAIKSAIEWLRIADRVLVYRDLGISEDMAIGIDTAELCDLAREDRRVIADRDPRPVLADLDVARLSETRVRAVADVRR